MYTLHRRSIDLYESTYGAKAIPVTRNNLLDLAQYGHRLVWWQQNKLPAQYGTPRPPVDAGSSVAAALTPRG